MYKPSKSVIVGSPRALTISEMYSGYKIKNFFFLETLRPFLNDLLRCWRCLCVIHRYICFSAPHEDAFSALASLAIQQSCLRVITMRGMNCVDNFLIHFSTLLVPAGNNEYLCPCYEINQIVRLNEDWTLKPSVDDDWSNVGHIFTVINGDQINGDGDLTVINVKHRSNLTLKNNTRLYINVKLLLYMHVFFYSIILFPQKHE